MIYKRISLTIALVFILLSCGNKKAKTENVVTDKYDTYLLVGTYTGQGSKGINVYKFDTESGESLVISEAEVSNPSYMVVSKDEKFVYAISENDAENSKVTAFKFNKNEGKLEEINAVKSGSGPAFISIDETGKLLTIANYGGGSISTLCVQNDGKIELVKTQTFEGKSLHPDRQTKPYLHQVLFSPDGRFLFANDLGSDKIYRFQVHMSDTVNPLKQTSPKEFSVRAGSGPRHTEFHPNGKFAYTITEISGDVIAFAYNAKDGLLSEIQTIKADTLNAQGSGDIHITPNGKFLYASNRLKGDGLAIFSIDKQSGMLTKIGYQPTGIHPRNFVIVPNGKLLLVANRDTNNIQVFKIENTGLLTDLKKDINLSMPVCLKFASIK